MEGLSTTPLLSSYPVVNQIIPGSNISVNKNIGDVTISSGGGGGGGTQTIVKYANVNVGGQIALSGTSQIIYSTTITTTTAGARIVGTCMFTASNNSSSATTGILQMVIANTTASPEFHLLVPGLNVYPDAIVTNVIQGSALAGVAGTYNVEVHGFGDVSTIMFDGNIIAYTNVING
jgi:hypothetical protein